MGFSEEQRLKVLMFPWLAYGHISPLLELAKKLSHNNFDLYIFSTPATLSYIGNRITKRHSKSIHLLDLHLTDSFPELPPHCHTTNGLPPRLHPALSKALEMAKPDFLKLLESLQPDVVIVDLVVKWAYTAACAQGFPALKFSIFNAATLSHLYHMQERPGVEFPFPSLRLAAFGQSVTRTNLQFLRRVPVGAKELVLVNTSRVLDGKYMGYASELKNWDIKPIGALVQCSNDDDDDDDDDDQEEEEEDELIRWLGTKEGSSSVLVAFGSECYLSREAIGEMASGLERSNANFIWIVRAPKGEEMRVQESLPKGFLERVEGRGKIVEKWAPQVKILKHPSVAAFVSHCGWSSILESMELGVPIIGVPVHLDQPVNARVLEELGIGVEVERDGDGKIQGGELSKVIKDVVFGERGEILRRRMGELKESVRSTCDGEMEEVVETLRQMCQRKPALTYSAVF